ncbi:hypothetical protein [Oceanobacillus neutriphilus]|uniref:Uncharacterized protein n=1 Tax=Oceanobacillus neutriphilus TaxID=531815 RepID=A0ABQ2P244_9BACI|nr:hypothetical protein [Oceanobacillus neutriphilus]GGP16255.1 hypothetical protein GCM10011346_47500 [Oceanobacillus neutriphilus]
MVKYRKKPVVIEAIQYNEDNKSECIDFIKGDWSNPLDGSVKLNQNGEFFIRTLEGLMKVSNSDYIIKGVKGEFYPCKPDIFESTYEKM